MNKTTLVNLRTYSGPRDFVLIDRRTIFGNHRYKIGQWSSELKRTLTREDCVSLFKRYFKERIKRDAAFRTEVKKLVGKKIACWCTPLACHGDVYVEYLNKENESSYVE